MKRDGWPWIVGGFLVVGAGAIIAFVVPDEDVQRIAAAVNVMLIGGLILVTTHYAVSTRQMVGEMQKQRYDTLRPILDVRVYVGGGRHKITLPGGEQVSNYFQLCVSNQGSGPAMNITCALEGVPGYKSRFSARKRTVLGVKESIGHFSSASIQADWSLTLQEQHGQGGQPL